MAESSSVDELYDPTYVRRVWVAAIKQRQLQITGATGTYGDRHMPKWDGGTSRSGSQHRAIWPRIALFLKGRGLPVERIIKHVVSAYQGAMLPPPTLLLNERIVDEAAAATRQAPQVLQQQLITENAIFQTQEILMRFIPALADLATRYRALLLNRKLSLSPLFRFCAAHQLNMHTVAATWQHEARQQYLTDAQSYRVAWANFLTESSIAVLEGPQK